jgi:hypothetical protein
VSTRLEHAPRHHLQTTVWFLSSVAVWIVVPAVFWGVTMSYLFGF